MTQFLQEIQEQPQALLHTAEFYDSPQGKAVLAHIAELWQSGNYTTLLLTGMGSSYFIATATAALLNRLHIPAFAVNAGELLHYQLPLIQPKTLLLCISQSGESYEVIKLIEKLPSDTTVLSICNEENSTLVKHSRYSLLCKAGKEEKTSTKTFITCYQVAYLLAMSLCRKKVDPALWNRLSALIENMVKRDAPWMEKAIALIDKAAFIQLIARGPLFASASQGALMFMEATHTPASALLGGEFRHGPLEMVKEGFIAILFAHSQSGTYEQACSLMKDILKYEGKVIFITDTGQTPENGNLCTITVPWENADTFSIPAVVPVQLLINAWASRQGMIPGEFTHGAKVTAIE